MPDIDEIIKEVNISLDGAEKIWEQVAPEFINDSLVKAFSSDRLTSSNIPGYPFIDGGKPQVGKFIAFVLDIRNSTKHLIQAISAKSAKASQLERVLYENTAINTAGAMVINHYNGGITEFLGDGFLALFKVLEPKDVYKAHNSAKYFLNTVLPELNKILNERYELPNIEIGIGLAYSKAIVTVVGHGNNIHPKAIGECVYRASKLSGGINTILIDERLEKLWPTSKGGKLKFFQITNNIIDFKAFKIGHK